MLTERRDPLTQHPSQMVEPAAGQEVVDPRLLQTLLTLDENEVIVPLPMKRQDVRNLRAVKLSDAEVVTISKFQTYLHDRGYLFDNTFASLVRYVVNVAFTWHKQLAEEEARREEETP